MNRNDSDIYTSCNRKTWLSDMCYESDLANDSHSAVSEMAGSIHAQACCLSKARSSLEAGKKQPRVWLQYSCGKTEMFLYPSFGIPLVLLRSPHGDSEMARNGFEDGSKWCAMGNTCSSVNEAGFMGLRTYVQEPMKLCEILKVMN